MKLNEMKAGEKGKIRTVSGEPAFVRRITAVGMTPGSNFEVIRNERKCPMLLYVRNTMLAVNTADCGMIEVEVTA